MKVMRLKMVEAFRQRLYLGSPTIREEKSPLRYEIGKNEIGKNETGKKRNSKNFIGKKKRNRK